MALRDGGAMARARRARSASLRYEAQSRPASVARKAGLSRRRGRNPENVCVRLTGWLTDHDSNLGMDAQITCGNHVRIPRRNAGKDDSTPGSPVNWPSLERRYLRHVLCRPIEPCVSFPLDFRLTASIGVHARCTSWWPARHNPALSGLRVVGAAHRAASHTGEARCRPLLT